MGESSGGIQGKKKKKKIAFISTLRSRQGTILTLRYGIAILFRSVYRPKWGSEVPTINSQLHLCGKGRIGGKVPYTFASSTRGNRQKTMKSIGGPGSKVCFLQSFKKGGRGTGGKFAKEDIWPSSIHV